MLKNIIAPVQTWLLSQGRCVGCGKNLEKQKGNDTQKATCSCGRIYMYVSKTDSFRRATLDEIS